MARTQTISSYKSVNEYGEANVVSITSGLETVDIGGSLLQFGMTPDTVHRRLGKPDCTQDNFGFCKHITECYCNNGFILRYCNSEASYPDCSEMALYEVMIAEKNGWHVEVNGIYLFDDEKLSQMKSQYFYTESKKKTAVAFPTLGILTVGCGEKENDAHTEKGKLIFFCNSEAMRFYISKISMWD